MIIIYHIAGNVTSIENLNGKIIATSGDRVTKVIFNMATQFRDEFVLWCTEGARDQLNKSRLEGLFHHQRLMLSYGDITQPFLGQSIGYIEDSPFIKVRAGVTYPTWQMHSYVGGIHASVLVKVESQVNTRASFDLLLNTLSRKLQSQGLICLSEPQLLRNPLDAKSNQASPKELYEFVKQNYKTSWLFFLFYMQWRYEQKLSLQPLLRALFFVKRGSISIDFKDSLFHTSKTMDRLFEVDVVIPTLGRAEQLYNVLKDLRAQDVLPKKVIIVEQIPQLDGVSQLAYLTDQEWPFTIDHTLITTLGACNARNIALEKVTAPWTLLFDDDVRMKPTLLRCLKKSVKQTGAQAITMSCLQINEKEKNTTCLQWPTFGSGCSLIQSKILKFARFDIALEHGYGEDMDFGMQMRNAGVDILYVPHVQITHLKAAIGGFRSPFSPPWEREKIQPKPSPQIMYHRLKNTTMQQLKGYKLVLFFKFYRNQPIKNLYTYYKYFKKAWQMSVKWSKKLPLDVS